METHRYFRSHLSRNNEDSYNAVLSSNQCPSPVEYWTNGRTTEYTWSPNSMEKASTDKLGRQRTTASPRKRPLPPHQQQQDRNNVRNTLIAGSFSGILATIGIYPMDVLRTKMQTGGVGGPWQILKHTVGHGGVRALYTGLALPLAAQAVYKATVFTVNNVTQNVILDYRTLENSKLGFSAASTGPEQLTLGDRFWCGFVGGAVNAAVFVTPVEFVRNQLIAQHSKLAAVVTAPTPFGKGDAKYFRGSWDVIRHAFQNQGVLSLWRGTAWSVGRDGIGCGCFFYTITWAQQMLTPVGEKPSFPVTLLSGGLAGLSFWVAALPMDSIKTWIQSSDVEAATVTAKDAIRKIYSEHGFVGVLQRLNRGWQVAYGRGIPSAAITITTYSLIYDHLQQGETV